MRTGRGFVGWVDGAGGVVVSCVRTGICCGFGSVFDVVVGGGGGRDGRRMASLGKGTSATGTTCEPGRGTLSVDGVT
jgi:hypothetical protein